MKVKVTDYIVSFLINKGITDVFGYPGGMVTHLMESFRLREESIHAHVNYHEQGAAFCACAYAQASAKSGVAYATSGPGATNLITGICNAYFDSIPGIFITGQVNTFESKEGLAVRQRGFQETDIVSIIEPVTKYSSYVKDASLIRLELEKAWFYANDGRKGPVLLDIPMNVQRSMIDPEALMGFEVKAAPAPSVPFDKVAQMWKQASRPVFLVGAGAKSQAARICVARLAETYGIPVISSMLAFDVLPSDHECAYGFIGAYGDRMANFIAAKSDLVLSLGARLDVRQVGAVRENFAPDARLIRVDIDKGELSNSVKERELKIQCDVLSFLNGLEEMGGLSSVSGKWNCTCRQIRALLKGKDEKEPNRIIRRISREIPENTVITTDVGQNQVWVAQSFEVKRGQEVLFSGGHGAMGYSLPAAIGAYYGKGKTGGVVCFNGDGGIQMNIQELQFIAREKLPIVIVIMNNNALGMIRHFQEMYFEDQYYQTVPDCGYSAPDFKKLADAYGLTYHRIENERDIPKTDWSLRLPQVVEVALQGNTYVFPKLEFGKPNQDQEPLLDRKLYNRIMEL